MPQIQFSKRDLLRDKLVAPAWYLVLIDTIGEWTSSKDGKSYNMIVEGTIVKDADNGSEDFKDVPIGGMGAWSFNTKAQGFALGLIRACAKQLGVSPEDITADTKIEMKHLEGKYVEMHIINDSYEGRLKNKADHGYREPKL